MRRCGFKIVIYINVLTEKNITLTAVFQRQQARRTAHKWKDSIQLMIRIRIIQEDSEKNVISNANSTK